MGFRSDLGAAQARSDALQHEVEQLKRENAALRDERAPKTDATVESGASRRSKFFRSATLVFLFWTLPLGAFALYSALRGNELGSAIAGALMGAITLVYLVFVKLVQIAPPGFVLVISGRTRRAAGGRTVGYRFVRGGHTLRVPFLETVDKIDVRSRTIKVSVKNAYTKTPVPIDIAAEAVVGITPTEPSLCNAVERFLGRGTDEVDRVARETLEGHLRQTIAGRTVSEVKEGTGHFEAEVIASAEPDFANLGLFLDTFSVQEIDSR